MGWDPIKDAKKWFKKIENLGKDTVKKVDNEGNKVVNSVKRAGTDAVKQVERAGTDTANRVQGEGNKVVNNIRDARNEGVGLIRREAKQVGENVEKAVTEKLPDLVCDQLQELAKAFSGEGLRIFRDMVKGAHVEMGKVAESRPELVGAIDNVSMTFKPGPTTLVYSGFYSRAKEIADALDHYVNHPPVFTRSSFLGIIRAIAPTTVDLGISVNFALVVGSKELGIGGELGDIETELFLELGDVLLKKLGVPA